MSIHVSSTEFLYWGIVITGLSMPAPTPIAASRTTQGPTGQTKDDAYDNFMKEIEDFIWDTGIYFLYEALM